MVEYSIDTDGIGEVKLLFEAGSKIEVVVKSMSLNELRIFKVCVESGVAVGLEIVLREREEQEKSNELER